jgi:hypothetical protein
MFHFLQYVKNLPEWNRHVALELYYEGSDFLYGALFRICFPHYKYFDLMTNNNDNNKNPQSNGVVSFALFSVPHYQGERGCGDQMFTSNITIE